MTRVWYCVCLLTLGVVGVLSDDTPAINQEFVYKNPGTLKKSEPGSLGIYKGKNTSIKKHPYLVAINFKDDLSCDGVIFDERWVLTLGDCLFGYNKKNLKVIAGSTDGLTGKSYSVEKIKVHPEYGKRMFDYDYGLLKIKGKFKWSATVKKAHLPKKDLRVKSKTVVVGWTPTSTGFNLEEGKMNVISRKDCEKIYENSKVTLNVTAQISCLYDKGKTSPCAGDISDLVMEGRRVVGLLSAVGSRGQCTSQALPAVIADVHAALHWIRNTTNIHTDY